MPEPRTPPPTEEELHQWPTKGRAAAILGMSTWYIVKAVKRGDLNEYESEDHFKRYDPNELEQLRSAKALQDQFATDLLDMQAAALKTAHAQLVTLANLVIDPKRDACAAVQEVNRLLQDENKALREENRQLRAEKQQSMVAFENLLSQSHMRDLAAMAVRKEQDRVDQAVGGLMKYGPKLLGQFAMGATLKKFVESLRPEQVMFLKETEGFLDDEQQARLNDLLERYNQQAKEAAEEAETDGSNGASKSSPPPDASSSSSPKEQTNV